MGTAVKGQGLPEGQGRGRAGAERASSPLNATPKAAGAKLEISTVGGTTPLRILLSPV